VGDVVYSTKVYYTEGGKEEADGMRIRPVSERAGEALIQLAHRVAKTEWKPADHPPGLKPPKATPAVVASGEKVLTSTSPTAPNYQRIKSGYNDSQAADMEGFGFFTALQDQRTEHRMIIRGISDKIEHKAESDAKGNQPLAAKNAAAFLFALLQYCPDLCRKREPRRERSSWDFSEIAGFRYL